MQKTVYTCDICRKEKDISKIYQIKVRSTRFIDYVNHDVIGKRIRWIDICQDCYYDFKNFLIQKENQKKNENF